MIALGSTEISKVCLGSNELSKVCLGSTEIWSSQPPPLPYDAEVEYLESTGTQWIDIGIQGVTKSDEWTAVASRVENAATTLFGYVQGSTYATLTMYHGSRKNVELAWGTTGNTITSSLPSLDEFHTYSMTSNGSVISLTIDGVTMQQTRNAFNNTANYGMGLFCRTNGGTPQLFSKLKLKSFQYERNGVLIRDFIPVRKGQVGYLYDKVSGNLFGNVGSGDFVIGNDIN